jgi:uncharacterized protein (DUF2267 family)
MDRSQFIAVVEAYAGIESEEAERATRATLATLAERIPRGEARDVAAYLDDELRPFLKSSAEAQAFDVQEFLRRVAEREGVSVPTAARHARAVFTALGRAVSRREQRDVAHQLSKDFSLLIEAMDPAIAHVQTPRPDEVGADAFVQRVADRLGADRATAWRAIDAVLEMLGRRISHGEVDDLLPRLPPPLAGPLEHGISVAGDEAQAIPVEGFVAGIVVYEQVAPGQAIEHTRAVFATLREFVGEKELSDVVAQLPKDYDVLLPRDDDSDEDVLVVEEVELIELVEFVRADAPAP